MLLHPTVVMALWLRFEARRGCDFWKREGAAAKTSLAQATDSSRDFGGMDVAQAPAVGGRRPPKILALGCRCPMPRHANASHSSDLH